MSDENGSNIGGDGSVRWEVISGDEIVASDASPEPAASKYRIRRKSGRNGTRCVGLDNQIGKSFIVSLRVPTKMTPQDFLASFKLKRGRVRIELPIEKGVAKQIKIRWGKEPTGV